MKLSIQKDQITFGASFIVLYLSWVYFFVGLKPDHLGVAAVMGLGSMLHRNIFKVLLGVLAFIIFWILYDSLQVLPNYEINEVNIQSLYDLELRLFGFEYKGQTIIPCEFFLENQVPLFSFFLGLAYLMWMPVPFIFSFYLFKKNKALLVRYSYAFLFVNLIGFIGYYAYPAAPPWYYFKYGTELLTNINGDAGLLVNFDQVVGAPIFDSIYNRGTNVFCAIPSLHCAFTIINLYYAVKLKNRYLTVTFIFLAIGTFIAAVYSQHHYVVDVILGIMTALFSILLYEILNFKLIFKPLTDWVLSKITEEVQ